MALEVAIIGDQRVESFKDKLVGDDINLDVFSYPELKIKNLQKELPKQVSAKIYDAIVFMPFLYDFATAKSSKGLYVKDKMSKRDYNSIIKGIINCESEIIYNKYVNSSKYTYSFWCLPYPIDFNRFNQEEMDKNNLQSKKFYKHIRTLNIFAKKILQYLNVIDLNKYFFEGDSSLYSSFNGSENIIWPEEKTLNGIIPSPVFVDKLLPILIKKIKHGIEHKKQFIMPLISDNYLDDFNFDAIDNVKTESNDSSLNSSEEISSTSCEFNKLLARIKEEPGEINDEEELVCSELPINCESIVLQNIKSEPLDPDSIENGDDGQSINALEKTSIISSNESIIPPEQLKAENVVSSSSEISVPFNQVQIESYVSTPTESVIRVKTENCVSTSTESVIQVKTDNYAPTSNEPVNEVKTENYVPTSTEPIKQVEQNDGKHSTVLVSETNRAIKEESSNVVSENVSNDVKKEQSNIPSQENTITSADIKKEVSAESTSDVTKKRLESTELTLYSYLYKTILPHHPTAVSDLLGYEKKAIRKLTKHLAVKLKTPPPPEPELEPGEFFDDYEEVRYGDMEEVRYGNNFFEEVRYGDTKYPKRTSPKKEYRERYKSPPVRDYDANFRDKSPMHKYDDPYRGRSPMRRYDNGRPYGNRSPIHIKTEFPLSPLSEYKQYRYGSPQSRKSLSRSISPYGRSCSRSYSKRRRSISRSSSRSRVSYGKKRRRSGSNSRKKRKRNKSPKKSSRRSSPSRRHKSKSKKKKHRRRSSSNNSSGGSSSSISIMFDAKDKEIFQKKSNITRDKIDKFEKYKASLQNNVSFSDMELCGMLRKNKSQSVGSKEFSVENALNILDNSRSLFGHLSTALQDVIMEAKSKLPDVSLALKVFDDPNVKTLIEMCLDNLKGKRNERDDGKTQKVIKVTEKLMKEVENLG